MDLLTDFLQPGKVIFRKKIYDPDTVMAGIESVARHLNDNLVSDSPFIHLFASNHIKTVFSYFGIIKARRVCVIVDPHIGRIELDEMMLDTPPAACIRIDSTTETFDFEKEIELRNQAWKDDPAQDLSDVCTMIYTAAEDGYAKAAMLTHENMLANARCIVEAESLNGATMSCGLSHLHHLYSLQANIIAPFLAKGGVYINDLSAVISLSSITATIGQPGLTHFYSIPFVYYLLCKVKDIFTKSKSFQSFGSGGYKLTEDIFYRFFKITGKEIHEGYGLSEASPVCTWTYEKVKLNSVGVSFPCCAIKIFSESGETARCGRIGEICVKGKNVMKGYYKNPEATNNVLRDGWLHTGDIGYVDGEGYVCLTGMKKRMINYGGKKVYPAEVERLIGKNENVLKIEIFGVDDQLLGQKVHARILLHKNTPQTRYELMQWCHRNLSKFKIYSKEEFL